MIQLNDDWRVTTISYNFVLQNNVTIEIRKDLKPTGKTRKEWRDVSYFCTLEGAINDFISKQVGESQSLEEIPLKREKALNHIKSILIPIDWFQNAYNMTENRKEINDIYDKHKKDLREKLRKELDETDLKKALKEIVNKTLEI